MKKVWETGGGRKSEEKSQKRKSHRRAVLSGPLGQDKKASRGTKEGKLPKAYPPETNLYVSRSAHIKKGSSPARKSKKRPPRGITRKIRVQRPEGKSKRTFHDLERRNGEVASEGPRPAGQVLGKNIMIATSRAGRKKN